MSRTRRSRSISAIFRNELDTKEHQERFCRSTKYPESKKEGMAIYLLFLQHIIYSLKPGGKAAAVVLTGFITAQSGIDKRIRQKLVDKKILAGVVSMPSNHLRHHWHQRLHPVYRRQ